MKELIKRLAKNPNGETNKTVAEIIATEREREAILKRLSEKLGICVEEGDTVEMGDFFLNFVVNHEIRLEKKLSLIEEKLGVKKKSEKNIKSIVEYENHIQQRIEGVIVAERKLLAKEERIKKEKEKEKIKKEKEKEKIKKEILKELKKELLKEILKFFK